MGRRGTDVAREAADIVLLDDSFGSIVGGIRLGRRIFANLRKALTFIVAVHVPLAGLALLPILLGAPPMLFPAHPIFLELVIDPVCSLVFEAEPSEKDAMRKPPRKVDAALFGPRQIAFGVLQGLVILFGVLSFYLWALQQIPETQARAAAFVALAMANMVLALTDSASSGVPLFDPHRRIFWRASDVQIEGDPAAQQALRFAAYHLNGAVNPDNEFVSVAARGLTGEDYAGHVFWDTEIFLLPFYCLTWPEAARALLMYRFHTLDGAREKAARLGWRGALYAWESADTGADVTPDQAVAPDRQVFDILCGSQEQHISADVAYAVWQYWTLTRDEAFLLNAGAEILLETARFWVSRAVPEEDGRRHIREVIGPDEYHESIDDNAFTNVMARWNIERGVEVANLLRQHWPDRWAALSMDLGLTDTEFASWPAAAEALSTGFNADTGLFEQFEGYSNLEDIDLQAYEGRSVPIDVVLGRDRTAASQIIKQADVVALLVLLPEAFPDGADAANFAWYAPRCSHGSSLSTAMHGLAAARLGRTRQALDYFRRTSAIDLSDAKAAIGGGLHMAALGGVWMTTVMGFAGVSFTEDGIRLRPQLPPDWTTMHIPLQWRGRALEVAIDAVGQSLSIVVRTGEAMAAYVGDARYWLEPGQLQRMPLAYRDGGPSLAAA